MAFKCDQCDKEFNTEEGLNQHKHDKHGVKQEKKEIKKEREEQRKVEIDKKVKGKKTKKWIIVAAVIVALIAGGYFVATSLPKSSGTVVGPPGSTHTHQDMKVYINGKAIDFSLPKYQLRSRAVHFEGGDGFVIHTHATGMTLAYALNTLGIKLDECLTVDGVRYCNSSNSTLKIYVNGAQISDVNYLFQDLDKVLVSYGPETDLTQQLASVTDLAKTQSGRTMTV